MMAFQEIGDGTEGETEYQRWIKQEKMRALFHDGKVLPYCFYPKKVIKVVVFNNYDFMIKIVSW